MIMRQRTASAGKADARKKFARYKKEEPKHGVSLKKTEETAGFRRLLGAWERFGKVFKPQQNKSASYDQALSAIREKDYSPADVMKFSVMLAEFEGEGETRWFEDKEGIFLSAIINAGKDGSYRITTSHLTLLPDAIGYANTKNIVVEGPAGHFVGYEMESGIIVVKGDAKESVGISMQGGMIIVEGNAGIDVGFDMKGGEIHVHGSIEDLATQAMGRIYHKGRLIYDGEKEGGNASPWCGRSPFLDDS